MDSLTAKVLISPGPKTRECYAGNYDHEEQDPRLTPLAWTNIRSLRHWGDGMVNRSIGEFQKRLQQFSDHSHEGDVLAPLEKLA